MASPTRFRKLLVSVVGMAALAAPAAWMTTAGAQPQPDPDANGDVHSNCHTGSKFRGAGGEDRPKEHGNGESGDCGAAPVTPETPSAAASVAPGAAASNAPAGTTAGAPVPVQAPPRTVG